MDTGERTQFAMQAIGLAELFRYMFGNARITAPLSYRVELAKPEGPSTGGGKQAVQHVTLVAESGKGTIVIGSANQVERSVELRTWNRLAEIHAQRFKGARLPLDMAQYGQLLNQLKEFFENQNLPIVLLDAEAPLPVPRAASGPSEGGGMIWVWVVLGVLVGVAVTYFATR